MGNITQMRVYMTPDFPHHSKCLAALQMAIIVCMVSVSLLFMVGEQGLQ